MLVKGGAFAGANYSGITGQEGSWGPVAEQLFRLPNVQGSVPSTSGSQDGDRKTFLRPGA